MPERIKRVEVERQSFFAGWPEAAPGYRAYFRPQSEFGPVDVTVQLADGREFGAQMSSVLRSPHSPDVLQVYYDEIRAFVDGTPMSECERRQIAQILVTSREAQLFVSPEELARHSPR